MGHATEDRNTLIKEDVQIGDAPIASGVEAFKGTLALLNSAGALQPASGVYCAGLVVDPVSDMDYDNVAGDAARPLVRFRRRGSCVPALSATHPPTAADIGKPCFAEDNQTISLDPSAGPYVGIVRVDDQGGVYCELDPADAPAGVGGYSWADQQDLEADTPLVFSALKKYFPVEGDGGAVVLTADFPDGSHAGQEIVLVGQDDSNTVTVPTGINTLTESGASIVLSANASIGFVWTGSVWIETFRKIVA